MSNIFHYPLRYYLFIIWIVSQIILIIWMSKVQPGRYFSDRYPMKVLILSQLPFGRWKNSINKEDLDRFKRYQYRFKIWYLSLFVPLISYFVYEFVKSILLLQSLKPS